MIQSHQFFLNDLESFLFTIFPLLYRLQNFEFLSEFHWKSDTVAKTTASKNI